MIVHTKEIGLHHWCAALFLCR